MAKKYKEKTDNAGALNEPMPAVYNSNAMALNFILNKQAPNSSIAINFHYLDLINLSREGIKKDAIKSLNNYLDITMEQMAKLLGTTYRNLYRKDGNEVLDNIKTEKAIELATFARRGVQVIGSEDGFKKWLKTPIKALSNKAPLDFLDTTFGIQLVLKVLGRMEHGVYS